MLDHLGGHYQIEAGVAEWQALVEIALNPADVGRYRARPREQVGARDGSIPAPIAQADRELSRPRAEVQQIARRTDRGERPVDRGVDGLVADSPTLEGSGRASCAQGGVGIRIGHVRHRTLTVVRHGHRP